MFIQFLEPVSPALPPRSQFQSAQSQEVPLGKLRRPLEGENVTTLKQFAHFPPHPGGHSLTDARMLLSSHLHTVPSAAVLIKEQNPGGKADRCALF